MPLGETRAAVKERLRAEGRWAEALAYRERLKAEGVPPAEAWVRMLAEFPPLAVGQAGTPPAEATKYPPVKRRRRCPECKRNKDKPFDWRTAVVWVFFNLNRKRPRACPWPLCVPMLEYARKNENVFFERWLGNLPRERRTPKVASCNGRVTVK